MADRATRKRRRTIIFSLIGALAVGLSLTAFFWKRQGPLLIQEQTIQRRDITEVVEATGQIEPVYQVNISPEVSGEITELPVKEGQKVKKGDLLLRIKPDYYIANRKSAEANLKATRATQDVAAANLANAKAEYERNRDLYQGKLISESQYLDAKTAYDVAKAQFQNAEYQAQVAQATLARAEEELRKTSIYSPLDGIVTQLNSEVGERVVGTATMAGTVVMTLSDLNQMEARVNVSETDINLIKKDQEANLQVDAFRDRRFHGTVYEVGNTAQTTGAGTQQEATKFQVRIRIEDKASFRPGMSVTAEIQTRHRHQVPAVPLQSVTTRPSKQSAAEQAAAKQREQQQEEGGPVTRRKSRAQSEHRPQEVVFLDVKGRAKMVSVKLGISDDNYVEILKGVKPGEKVISGGFKAIQRELKDGMPVQLGPQPTASLE